MSAPVEIIQGPNGPLAYIVHASWRPQKTEFITPSTLGQQLGMIVYPKGGVIQPHLHLPVVREVHGTLETLFVRSGRCEVDFYDEQKVLVGTRTLELGDVMLLTGGGHGFRMLEDTVLCEVKQGPYVETKDKERF